MKKEDFVSTFVMTTVSILMLVGVTIAWYTAVYAHPTVTGMQMEAEEQGSIKIALVAGGKDIAELEGDAKYAKIGFEDLVNIENGQMAPGAYGSVTFYVTSLNQKITSCQVVPSLVPKYEEGVEEEDETSIEAILEKHFDFYTDPDMTNMVTEENPYIVELGWNETGVEEIVTIYWKWHYEDPSADNMEDGAEKEAIIYQYDMEDTQIGTHLDTMSFHFDFLAIEGTQTSQE